MALAGGSILTDMRFRSTWDGSYATYKPRGVDSGSSLAQSFETFRREPDSIRIDVDEYLSGGQYCRLLSDCIE